MSTNPLKGMDDMIVDSLDKMKGLTATEVSQSTPIAILALARSILCAAGALADAIVWRADKSKQGHSDTERIDWLNEHAGVGADNHEYPFYGFSVPKDTRSDTDAREVIDRAIEESRG